MTDIKHSFYGSSGPVEGQVGTSDWVDSHIDDLALAGTTGTISANLTDITGAPTGISASVTAAFSNDARSTDTPPGSPYGYPGAAYRGSWYTPNGGTSTIVYSGFTPGEAVTVVVAAWSANTSRSADVTVNGVTQTYTVTSTSAPDAPLTFNTTADGSGNVTVSVKAAAVGGQYYGYLNFIHLSYGGGASPSVSDIDTDNAVNQYQQGAVVALSGFTESITSVTLNGVACPIVSQVVGASVTVDIPALSATGTYDLVVSGATETATLTGVSYTLTHPIQLPLVPSVDSNSVLMPINYPDYTHLKVVADFATATFKTGYADWSAVPLENNVTDYIEFPNGTVDGTQDTATFEAIDSDGNTVQWSVTLTAGSAPVATSPSQTLTDWGEQLGNKSVPTNIFEHLQGLGYTGAMSDMLQQYLESKYSSIVGMASRMKKFREDGYQ